MFLELVPPKSGLGLENNVEASLVLFSQGHATPVFLS